MATLSAFEQPKLETDDPYNPIVSENIGLVNQSYGTQSRLHSQNNPIGL